MLARHGGALVLDDGDLVLAGELDAAPIEPVLRRMTTGEPTAGLLARQPGSRHRRDRAARRIGRARTGDVRPASPAGPGLAKLKRLHEASTLVALGSSSPTRALLRTAGCVQTSPASRCRSSSAIGSCGPAWASFAGWLALILGLSFYVRKWIGTRTWRWLHRWTLAVYVLALAAVGAGTDGRSCGCSSCSRP